MTVQPPAHSAQPAAATPRSAQDPARIASMFDAIAIRYDLLNRILSAGIDRRWRARAIATLSLTGTETLLDLCTGTADMAIAAVTAPKRAARAIGVDFAAAMLRVGREKIDRAKLRGAVTLVRGDASRIPLPDRSVHVATIAFGIRNVAEPAVVCREVHRVLRDRGRLAILEFGIPQIPGIRGAYRWYFHRVLPWIGRLVSQDRAAYTYLPQSVDAFPSPEAFGQVLRDAGFSGVQVVPLTFGIVYLYCATKTGTGI